MVSVPAGFLSNYTESDERDRNYIQEERAQNGKRDNAHTEVRDGNTDDVGPGRGVSVQAQSEAPEGPAHETGESARPNEAPARRADETGKAIAAEHGLTYSRVIPGKSPKIELYDPEARDYLTVPESASSNYRLRRHLPAAPLHIPPMGLF